MTENEQKAYELSDVLADTVISLLGVISEEEHEKIDSKCAEIINCLWELARYKDLGTVGEFMALKEKNEPKKVIESDCNDEEDGTWFRCPTCGVWAGDIYCEKCGQKLDWGEE